MNDEDTLRPEYPSKLIESGERGKYAKRYREGTNPGRDAKSPPDIAEVVQKPYESTIATGKFDSILGISVMGC
uniref:Uncharacterized protein n=1 Tax=Candidatus Kentrum sp. TUN TaxID=2126343 RepID=A0A451AHQ8_9GAMM|nr:MAG: hypothetical protein BECKTUN1418F_GA0071002_11135 [Candidatus Kentron sp. TUN]VFK65562.1 MAG: hypothetical protein BECKTUN1418E_GA0071001_11095 [Candidatus Kentron sp. TUN]